MLVCRNMSALLGISMPLMWRGACDDPATRKTGELDAALFVVRWRRILWTRKRRFGMGQRFPVRSTHLSSRDRP
ncbi:mitochondrial inner membrane protein OXA1-like [Musa troglodytarum]|uniref:Mitochondrial inner membrane protein OXA1-like n=1 Tax=Musa troglodytarum TaxID=320322 RepID=A0A9E7HL51_9LILI|nr:mitochondrial inner membrane protein OXA1-like [Musa troglodytarum]